MNSRRLNNSGAGLDGEFMQLILGRSNAPAQAEHSSNIGEPPAGLCLVQNLFPHAGP
jgi:hypothetical protein